MEVAEKRRSARTPTRLPALFSYATGIWTMSNGEAVTLDLSERGAQLVSERLLPLGEIIALTLELDGGISLNLQGRVVWVEQAGAEYRAGVAFRNMGPDEVYRIEKQLSRTGDAKPQYQPAGGLA